MSELAIWHIIAIVGFFTAPIIASQKVIFSKLGDLCERVTAEETKSKIYHGDKPD